MKFILIALLFVLLTTISAAQPKHYADFAFLTTQSSMPFGKFLGMFKETVHPGAEFTYGKNIALKKNHDWFLELKLAYFFHRYVQHGIPVYLNFGYRRLINKKFSAETSIGAGYMHSIPATQQFSQNSDGLYSNDKGTGRMQLIATYGLGLGYIFNPSAKKPIRLFTNYQQRIQFPFVKSYVPLLPYNSFMLGISKTIGK